MTRRPGSRYGSGRNSTPSTMVKTAVVAPIPRARVRMATPLNVGWRRKMRQAELRFWRKRLLCTSTRRPDALKGCQIVRWSSHRGLRLSVAVDLPSDPERIANDAVTRRPVGGLQRHEHFAAVGQACEDAIRFVRVR